MCIELQFEVAHYRWIIRLCLSNVRNCGEFLLFRLELSVCNLVIATRITAAVTG